MNENEIKDYFKSNRPQISDETTFIVGLAARMDAIQEIKNIHDKAVGHSRRIIVLVFFVGIILGGILSSYFILHPASLENLGANLAAIYSSISGEAKSAILILISFGVIVLSLIPFRNKILQ